MLSEEKEAKAEADHLAAVRVLPTPKELKMEKKKAEDEGAFLVLSCLDPSVIAATYTLTQEAARRSSRGHGPRRDRRRPRAHSVVIRLGWSHYPPTTDEVYAQLDEDNRRN